MIRRTAAAAVLLVLLSGAPQTRSAGALMLPGTGPPQTLPGDSVAFLAGAPPRVLRDGNLAVRFWPEHARLAPRILAAAAAARFPALPPGVLRQGPDVSIVLAPDPARFHALTGGRIPEWGAGAALPAAGVVVLPTFRDAPDERAAVLRHELAHLALHRWLAPARVPRWFDEGYARWAAGEWDWEAGWMLRIAFALRRAPPLDSLELGWPTGAPDARVAYLLAASAVAFLVERSGEYGLRRLLERWRAGGALESALRQTYGLTLSQFEEDWRREVRRRYGWLYFLSNSMVFWALTALLLLWLFHRRRLRDRAKLAQLRATEPPDAPAYWLEPPPEPEPRQGAGEPGSGAAPPADGTRAEERSAPGAVPPGGAGGAKR
ncbi:MAG: hypothetical protein HY561_02920 [Gemmatimonadetes bacterium]|nr:hypothetical protein [Gemmatimonadota bacterium]